MVRLVKKQWEKRLAVLYKISRKKLNKQGQGQFNMLLAMRKKISVEAVDLWTTQTEMIFAKYKEKTQTTVDT